MAIALLFIFTSAAFLYSQRLKREPLVIDRVDFVAIGAGPDSPASNRFSPNGDCRRDRMGIYFRTTRSDRMDVEIRNSGDSVVRTLASGRFFKRYREHRLIWDGRTDSGRIPPTGRYSVWIEMRDLDRLLELPGRIRLRNFEAPDSACPEAGAPDRKAARG